MRIPPAKSTKPVPIRLRMPSTSFMMRETSNTAFVGVVVGDREAADVLLHFAAQFGDEPLGFLGEQLGERERSDALNDGGAAARRESEARAGRSDALLRTLSTRNLVDAGRTSPQTRLTIINANPTVINLRRGRTSSLRRGRTLRRCSDVFFLGAAGDTTFRIRDVGREDIRRMAG